MREHGSFAVPLMHCWSLPCVMVSDESRCIIDRLHIVLGPWLTIHYAACALNFNYANNLKRLDSYKKISVFDIQLTYEGSSVCIKGARRWQMTLHQLVLLPTEDYPFLIEIGYFLIWLWQWILMVHFFPQLFFLCPSNISQLLSSLTRRIPILMNPDRLFLRYVCHCKHLQCSERQDLWTKQGNNGLHLYICCRRVYAVAKIAHFQR